MKTKGRVVGIMCEFWNISVKKYKNTCFIIVKYCVIVRYLQSDNDKRLIIVSVYR